MEKYRHILALYLAWKYLKAGNVGDTIRIEKMMEYCMFCGTKLHDKELEGEGMIPFCDSCGEYRFSVFSTAVSMIVMNRARDRILLIKQYGRDRYILVAGYVNKGEDAEDAVCREIKEELGLRVTEYHFNRSHYFKPSNTLMLNFTAVVEDEEPHPNREIPGFTDDFWRMRLRGQGNFRGIIREWRRSMAVIF